MPQTQKVVSLKGRPPHQPNETTRTCVRNLALTGSTKDKIAEIVGLSKATLYKHYRDELEHAKAKANADVAGALYQSAMNGNVSAQVFWLKTQAGWRQNPDTLDEPEAITVESEYADVSDRQFGRILAHALMLGVKGAYNISDAAT